MGMLRRKSVLIRTLKGADRVPYIQTMHAAKRIANYLTLIMWCWFPPVHDIWPDSMCLTQALATGGWEKVMPTPLYQRFFALC